MSYSFHHTGLEDILLHLYLCFKPYIYLNFLLLIHHASIYKYSGFFKIIFKMYLFLACWVFVAVGAFL